MERPDFLLECQRILHITVRRKPASCVKYLHSDDIQLLLRQPDISNRRGQRDLVPLSLLHDSGARVQEIAVDVRLEPLAQSKLVDKGTKDRVVPLMEPTVELLSGYLNEQSLTAFDKLESPLFQNSQRRPLTRAGISYILQKYTDMAREQHPLFPEKVIPHMLRHSKAMHLLEAGVNIVYIRDILGHVDVSTTEIYAKANLEMKCRALEKVSGISAGHVPFWTHNEDLLSWLESFGKQIS